MVEIQLGGSPTPASELLKEATKLKKAKKYIEACEKLREAYSAEGSGQLSVKAKLRLPMYLQLAGDSEQALEELNIITHKLAYADVFSQLAIADQTRKFYDKEKNYIEALVYLVWVRCKGIEAADFSLKDIEQQQEMLRKELPADLIDNTPDPAIKIFNQNKAECLSVENIQSSIGKALRKLKQLDLVEPLAAEISAYLENSTQYSLVSIRKLINKHIDDD